MVISVLNKQIISKERGKIKKLIVILTVFSFFMVSIINANAATKTITMDNDALPSSGTTNPPYDDGGFLFGCYNMNYVVGPNHYNDDARRTPKSEKGSYAWKHSFPSSTYKVKLSAHLWDPLFTDTSAHYVIGRNVFDYVDFGSFNQNTAPGGWNVIGTKNYDAAGATVYVSSGGSMKDKRTGGDAVRVVCTY